MRIAVNNQIAVLLTLLQNVADFIGNRFSGFYCLLPNLGRYGPLA